MHGPGRWRRRDRRLRHSGQRDRRARRPTAPGRRDRRGTSHRSRLHRAHRGRRRERRQRCVGRERTELVRDDRSQRVLVGGRRHIRGHRGGADRRRRVLRSRLSLHRRTEPPHHGGRGRRGGGRHRRRAPPWDVAAAIEAARLRPSDRAGFRGGCDDGARCGSSAPAVLRRPADARDGGGSACRGRRHGIRRLVRAASRRPRWRSSRGAAAGSGRRAGGRSSRWRADRSARPRRASAPACRRAGRRARA